MHKCGLDSLMACDDTVSRFDSAHYLLSYLSQKPVKLSVEIVSLYAIVIEFYCSCISSFACMYLNLKGFFENIGTFVLFTLMRKCSNA